MQYCDALQRWVEMAIQFDTIDARKMVILDGGGYLNSLACDYNARWMLQQAKQNRYIDFNGTDSNPSNTLCGE